MSYAREHDSPKIDFCEISDTDSESSDAQALVDPKNPQRELMCANPRCWYFVHIDREFGGFCCKKCHWVYQSGSKPKKKHGVKCKCVEAPRSTPRAKPIAPQDDNGRTTHAKKSALPVLREASEKVEWKTDQLSHSDSVYHSFVVTGLQDSLQSVIAQENLPDEDAKKLVKLFSSSLLKVTESMQFSSDKLSACIRRWLVEAFGRILQSFASRSTEYLATFALMRRILSAVCDRMGIGTLSCVEQIIKHSWEEATQHPSRLAPHKFASLPQLVIRPTLRPKPRLGTVGKRIAHSALKGAMVSRRHRCVLKKTK